jgi:hypothetical protein
MSKIKIIAGDLELGDWQVKPDFFTKDIFNNPKSKDIFYIEYGKPGKFKTVNLKAKIQSVQIMTEETKKKILGSTGWGITGLVVGSLIAAPVALAAGLAGVLKGGNRKEICFVCYLKDEKKFMGITDSKTYTKLQTLCF